MTIYWSYDDLLEAVAKTGVEVRILGHTVDGSPLVCARAGGDRLPAIFVTAGSHSTEHAGVSAAVELITHLDTEHQVYVLPSRDPTGLNGYARALSLGLGGTPDCESYDQVEDILRREGKVLFEEDDLILSLIGEYGYTCGRPSGDRVCPQWRMYKRLLRLHEEEPDRFDPLRGRRVWMVPGQPGIEGAGDFGRAYTLIISPEGEVLHINRFHDTVWSPIEPRAAVDLMAEIRPGISFDIHESQNMDDRYWLSARRQMDDEGQQWEERASRRVIEEIQAAGGTLAEDGDMPTGWFDSTQQAVFWLDATRRGEGLNLMDFASRQYGMAFGTEMGMYGEFEHRVKLGMVTVQTAVSVFEERYR